MNETDVISRGRFAPSPTGRMHLGNVWAALISYLSVKSKGGLWVLRHEDLDTQRSRLEYARQIEDDLHWLGLEWDEGGLDNRGDNGPYQQSLRSDIYADIAEQLRKKGLLYPCRCRRADLLAASAPHASDGRPVYGGVCRPFVMPQLPAAELPAGVAVRIAVDARTIVINDMFCGLSSFNLATDCGDFIIRRADGHFAYQLAVVADDAAMGITEVVRGRDLLPSAAQQSYIYQMLGWKTPRFGHIALLCNENGQRLSKRDKSLSMEELRRKYSPREIIGWLAFKANLIKHPYACRPSELSELFTKNIPVGDISSLGGLDFRDPLR